MVSTFKTGGSILILLILIVFGFTSQASAQSVPKRGSLLVFPYCKCDFTFLTITNTNLDRTRQGHNGTIMRGDVKVHFIFVDKNCQKFDKWVDLTPGETTMMEIVGMGIGIEGGWAFAVACDPVTGDPIDFDYLIGEVWCVPGCVNFCADAPAQAFRSLAEEHNPSAPGGRSGSGHAFADFKNAGQADMDNDEYERFPGILMAPSFIQQTPGFNDRFILISPFDRDWVVEVEALTFNNNEVVFSRRFEFTCCRVIYLRDLSAITKNLQGSPTEWPMGWMQLNPVQAINTITGERRTLPAILGILLKDINTQLGATLNLVSNTGRDAVLEFN